MEKALTKFSIKTLIADIALGVQFLSRLPVPEAWTFGRGALFSKTVWAFPIAGLILSLPAACVALLAIGFSLSPLTAAILLVATQILVSGALHEDGLADVADGFGGGRTAEQKLEIMKDSRIGAYGMLSLVCALLLRVALLAPLLDADMTAGISIFLASQVLSRGVMVYFWNRLPSARYRGLSHLMGRPDRKRAFVALAISLALAGILVAPFLNISGLVAISLLVVTGFYLFRRLCWKQIRGQTGDTLGACQILIELCVLLGVSISL